MSDLYPRRQSERIQLALADTPVVLLNGPRQCGKTTLAQQTLPEVPYYSLDDDTLLSTVRLDPQGFIRRLDRAIIDEVQRVPELLRTLKLAGPIPANAFLRVANGTIQPAGSAFQVNGGVFDVQGRSFENQYSVAVDGAQIAGRNLLVPARAEIKITYTWPNSHAHHAH